MMSQSPTVYAYARTVVVDLISKPGGVIGGAIGAGVTGVAVGVTGVILHVTGVTGLRGLAMTRLSGCRAPRRTTEVLRILESEMARVARLQ